jgi:GT2 family glycosyltransferase
MAKVSVVIILYNQKQWVGQAIESALAQTYKDVEIVVVNDGSTDDPLGVLGKHPVRVINKPNGGISSARNAGIAATDGEFIVTLDADDWIAPTYIEKLLPLMEDNVAAACTYIQFFGDNNGVQPVNVPTLDEELKGNELTCCALFRRSVFEEIGGYCEKLYTYEDWNMWIDILKRGYDVAVLDEPLFHYRIKNRVEDSIALQGRMRHAELLRLIYSLHPDLFVEQPRTNIVVLSKFPDIFKECKESIEKFAPHANKVLVRDGNDIVPPAGWTTVQGIAPFNYSRNANLGIKACKTGDVLLCNDDVTFLTEGTLEALQAYMIDYPKVGVLSPKIDGGTANRLQHADAPGEGTSSYYLAFVCVLLRRSAIDKVGLLDERYSTYGGDDVDYCRQIHNAGYDLAVTTAATVKHGHGIHAASSSYIREFGSETQAKMQDEAARVYQAKWGDLLFEWKHPAPAKRVDMFAIAPVVNHAGKPNGNKPKYSADSLTIDWWSNHDRV